MNNKNVFLPKKYNDDSKSLIQHIDVELNTTNINLQSQKNDPKQYTKFKIALSLKQNKQQTNEHLNIIENLINSNNEISIDCLIELGKLYQEQPLTKNTGIVDFKKLYYLTKPLTELNKMIGLIEIKKNIIQHTLFCIQNLHLNDGNNTQEMCHTIIYGHPGVGKTQLAKILGHIYITMGLIYKRSYDFDQFNIDDYFETVSRFEMVGMYCGHTAIQTQKIIDRCRKNGKVLFLDEIYALGEKDGKDNFGQECISTINRNLTEGIGEFICIFAGYEDDIKKCIFAHNKGLERRFTIRYHIDKYSPSEMVQIFMLKLNENGWYLETNTDHGLNVNFFRSNMEYFPYYAGDIITFIQKCKWAHAKRIFGKNDITPKLLNKMDIYNGFEKYKQNREFETQDYKLIYG